MYNGQFVSLKNIMWKVLNNPLAESLSIDQAGEFVAEGVRLIGAPLSFKDEVTNPALTVENYKAFFPKGSHIIFIHGMRKVDDPDYPENCNDPLYFATDIFHKSRDCVKPAGEHVKEMSYTFNGGVITTGFNEGYIQVAYRTLVTCDDGFPMIPDEQSYKLAMEYYILYRYLEPLWMMGKISDKAFEHVRQQKIWHMGSADTKLKIASYDHMEAIVNTVQRIVINNNAHKNYFQGAGRKEQIRRYS